MVRLQTLIYGTLMCMWPGKPILTLACTTEINVWNDSFVNEMSLVETKIPFWHYRKPNLALGANAKISLSNADFEQSALGVFAVLYLQN